MYRSLDSERIIETARVLVRRIGERFPDSGLSKLATEILAEARLVAVASNWMAKPLLWVRISVGVAIFLMLAGAFGTLFVLNGKVAPFSSVADFVQGLESATNEIVLLGIAVYFLLSLETRLKRARALEALHVLRSMAHIVDMHQLTKDPERVGGGGPNTPSSPNRHMTPFELARYLDYCSEALALLSKLAALYVQNFHDPTTISAVNEVEDLTAGLSRKVWQKIMILDRVTPTPAPTPGGSC